MLRRLKHDIIFRSRFHRHFFIWKKTFKRRVLLIYLLGVQKTEKRYPLEMKIADWEEERRRAREVGATFEVLTFVLLSHTYLLVAVCFAPDEKNSKDHGKAGWWSTCVCVCFLRCHPDLLLLLMLFLLLLYLLLLRFPVEIGRTSANVPGHELSSRSACQSHQNLKQG